MVAGLEIVAQPLGPFVDVAEVVRLVHQHRPPVRVILLKNDALSGRIGVHVSSQFLVELRVWNGGYETVGNNCGSQRELFVEVLPHGLESGGTEDERRTVVRGSSDPELAQQLRAYERLAKTHDVSDIAAAVGLRSSPCPRLTASSWKLASTSRGGSGSSPPPSSVW